MPAYALGLCGHTSGALLLSQAGSPESDVLTSGRINFPFGPPAILLLGILYSVHLGSMVSSGWATLQPTSLQLAHFPKEPPCSCLLWRVGGVVVAGKVNDHLTRHVLS